MMNRIGLWVFVALFVLSLAAERVFFRAASPRQPDAATEHRLARASEFVPSAAAAKRVQAPVSVASMGGVSAPVSQPGSALPVLSSQSAPSSKHWDLDFFHSLQDADIGHPVTVKLPGGGSASGIIQVVDHLNDELVYVSGEMNQPEPGRFFFQKQSAPGMAGDYAGVIEFRASQRAYRIEPNPTGGSLLVERSLDEVLCIGLPPGDQAPGVSVEEIPPLKPSEFPTVPIPSYQEGIVVLESLPGATAVLYLDFQGGYTPTWGGISYARPNVSNSQIRDVWVRVAEDYIPFNINVTTDLGVFQKAPEGSRQRVIVTPTNTAEPGAGGVAYVGSFNWTGDTPCWVFTVSGKNCAEAISHEAGHTLGLSHDGKDVDGVFTEYYEGQGSGDLSWAPIMGTAYSRNVSQWSKGEYANANNTQDDLLLIQSRNNDVAYRFDDTRDTLTESRYLDLFDDYSVTAQGVIEQTGDADAFKFSTSGGDLTLRADAVGAGPNLALELALRDAENNLVKESRPTSTLWASLSATVPAGTYMLSVSGSSRRNPLTDGFSNYGSLGYYSITGSISNARLPTRFAVPETAEEGAVVGVLTLPASEGHELTYEIVAGNTSQAFAIDQNGRITVANPHALDYETLARISQMPVQFELFINISDGTDDSLSETGRRVVITVEDVNEPPELPAQSVAVFERTVRGTPILTLAATDPDFYTLMSYAIVSGNGEGLFRLGSTSGELILAADLPTGSSKTHTLEVTVSDQAKPNPLVTTSLVTIAVLANPTPFEPGSIAYAAYTNISGSTLSSFTNSSRFPDQPDFEKQFTQFEGDRDWADRYGAVFRGYLIPSVSGSYTFWIASADGSQLWISSSTDPASLGLVAWVRDGTSTDVRQWTKYSNQKSQPRFLEAGHAYYIEARHREATGTDHLAVAWESSASGISRQVIPGRNLAPYPMNYAPRISGLTASLHRNAIQGARLGVVTALDANTNDTHSFEITSGNSAGLFSIDPNSGFLRVANEAALTATFQTGFSLVVRATDSGLPPRSGTATVSVSVVPTNAITTTTLQQELFFDIGNSGSVAELTNKAKFPRRPDALCPLSLLNASRNISNSFGSRVRAYLTPVSSGSFTFYLSSDAGSSLLLSPDNEPSGATQIASISGFTDFLEWDKYSTQQSSPVALTAGQEVYLEVLHKDGSGDDHLAVAWRGLGIVGTTIIGGSYLKPVDINYEPELADTSASVPVAALNGTVVTTLNALDSPIDSIAYKIVSGNEGNAFSIDPESGTISVNDSSILSAYSGSSLRLVVQAQDSGYGGLYPRRSAFANVEVRVTDDTFIWIGAGDTELWSESDNWGGMVPRLRAKLQFSGVNRQTNENDIVEAAGPVELRNGGFYLHGNPLLLSGGVTSSGNNTWAISSAFDSPQTVRSVEGLLRLAGSVDNKGQEITFDTLGSIDVSGSLSGTGVLRKTGSGTLTLSASNSLSGRITVDEGRLALTHAFALGSTPLLEISSQATLDVSMIAPFVIPGNAVFRPRGVVSGDLVVNGTMAPGSPGNPVMFSNSLQLAGSTFLTIQKSGGVAKTDQIQVTQDLSMDGELMITHSGEVLVAGDSFNLFQAGGFSGGFSQVALPELSPGLRWRSERLATEGILSVAATAPAIMPVAINAAGGLELRFQALAGVTYELQAAGNLAPDAQWTTVSKHSGKDDLMTLTLPVDSAVPAQFFRLRVVE